ncbi:MAG TPA: MFS transporter [Steroidobacteraceae bacterium]|jgi:DHA1 family tetracycline resistance protein-like MFS transporter
MPVNRRLGALFIVSVVDILGFGILIPLVPYMGVRFDTAPEWITPVMGSYSLCQLIAAPFWGRLSDRYGRRPILMSSLAGACLSYLILGFATNIWWLLLSRALNGFMAGNISAAFAYASDVSEPRRRAAALGLIGAAIGIGFTVGPAIGGVLAGDHLSTANFLRPALVSACLSISAILLVGLMLPESNTPQQRAQRAQPQRIGPIRMLLERPLLRLIACAALLVTSAQSILDSILGIWALNKYGYGPRTFGVLMFGIAFFAILTQGVLVRLLVPRLGEARLALIGVLVFATGLVLAAMAPGAMITVIGLALCGIGVGAFSPSASSLASKQSGSNDRGAVMGTYQSASSLARVIGPFVSGPVYSAWGPSAPFLTGACVVMPAALLIWRVRRSQLHSADTC